MTGLISLEFQGFPDGYCYPGDPDTFATDIMQYTEVVFNAVGNIYYNMGPDIPGADYRIYPWLRTEQGFEDGWYYWDDTIGAWIKPHPTPASGGERRCFVGSTTDLQTYEGGNANAVDDADGPFWEVDSSFAARFPVGVGSFDNAGDVGVTDTTTSTAVAGEDEHTLTLAELPADVVIPTKLKIAGAPDGDYLHHDAVEDADCGVYRDDVNDIVADGDPHNNLPPFYGVYFIKRTARIYFRAT